jgi:hypothetical protein
VTINSKDKSVRQFALAFESKTADCKKVVDGRFPSRNPHKEAVNRRLGSSGVFGVKPPKQR